MDKFLRALFSMRMMALGLFIFLAAIGVATFLESIYDIQTAKIIIYNALWFEILLVFLAINLIANIFTYKMYQREKIAMFLFHVSFIIILIGAGVTRFISFEGQMILPEPNPDGTLKPVNYIYSAEPKLRLLIHNNKMQNLLTETQYISSVTNNHFSYNLEFPGYPEGIHVEYVDFKSKHIDSVVTNDTIQNEMLNIVTNGMEENPIGQGEFTFAGDLAISYEKADAMPGILLSKKEGKIWIKADVPVRYLPMSSMVKYRQSGQEVPDTAYTEIPADTTVEFLSTTLYQAGGEQFVFKEIKRNTRKMLLPSGRKDRGFDYLTLAITVNGQRKEITLEGGMNQIGKRELFQFAGLNFDMQYGAVPIQLPITLACNDFQLEKYPGSESPSSFASIVSVIDNQGKVEHKQRIFMNNVMDYGGYRFFQSSYELDDPNTPENEEATKLSVNYDWWGTNITYLGYLIMMLAMMMSLFAPIGRFRELIRKITKHAPLIVFFMLGSTVLAQEHLQTDEHAGHDHTGHNHDESTHEHASTQELPPAVMVKISAEHAEKLAYLLVQDFDGRIVPMHTQCDKLLRKIHRGNTYQGMNAVQTIVSMHMAPSAWMDEPIIYVSGVLREKIGITEAYATVRQLLDEENRFKLLDDYQLAHKKLDKQKTEYDKQLIKLVERYQVIQAFPDWSYLKLIPVRGAENNTWYIPMNELVIQKEQDLFKSSMNYFKELYESSKNGDAKVDAALEVFKKQQRAAAGKLAPSETLTNIEVRYNKLNIFKRVQYVYLILGFILLTLFIITTTKDDISKSLKRFILGLTIVLAGFWLFHGIGLGMRWAISGHAPWSNGYEAVVFIAWITMLCGFLFRKYTGAMLGAAAILAFCMLFVTEMNLLDPEVTPLQPVLKSYWLMIHVAIITSSYGFLGIGAILAIINLGFYIARNSKNGNKLTRNINDISAVSEMSMTVGLFMLTIGTFLGGIWANESWGRYWGWDPKETWALVSVLTYAIVLHLRFIPGLKSKYVFNVASLWAYSSIIFTFFGVNFLLTGLHSYAQGDGLAKVPNYVIYIALVFLIFTVIAGIRNKQYKKTLR